jgi:hypothetical protein
MTNIVKFANAGLPVTAASVASVAQALRTVASEVGLSGGVAILKMDKTGTWVFGADQTEVQEGSLWAVNPFSFVHGYIAWGDGDVLGEKMAPVSQPLPALDAAPAGSKRGWEMQVGMSLKCLNGEDEGLEVRYCATSVGGKRAVQELAVAIAGQVDRDQTAPVPVVDLQTEHYQHKSYGKIFTPVFNVKKWIGMDGDVVEKPVDNDEELLRAAENAHAEPVAAAAPAGAGEPPRRRRRVVS